VALKYREALEQVYSWCLVDALTCNHAQPTHENYMARAQFLKGVLNNLP